MAKVTAIIRSLADQDLYSFTVGQAVGDNFPTHHVRYAFINRGGTRFPSGFANDLRDQLEAMAGLSFLPSEIDYLAKTCGHFLSQGYLNWLSAYRYNPAYVKTDQSLGDLSVIIEGPWRETIYFEVPLLATISELYGVRANRKPKGDWKGVAKRKGSELRAMGAFFSDFGTRRRFSLSVHEEVLKALIETAVPSERGGVLNGTSNVYLAMKYHLKPMGTMSHQWFMFHAAIYGYVNATRMALVNWQRTFGLQLGIALSDTFGKSDFYKAFASISPITSRRFADDFKGDRDDSGNPLANLERDIAFYRSLGIDPTTKTFLASDNLGVGLVREILSKAQGRVKCAFGIGTNLTNDVGFVPLNIVIKLREVLVGKTWIPVVKLSEEPKKHTGDSYEVARAKRELGLC